MPAITQATAGHGTQLQVSQDAGSTFKKIAEVSNIAGPAASANVIEVTNNESENFFAEYIGGKRDGGELTFDANYLPALASDATYIGSEDLFDLVGTRLTWRLTWTDTAGTKCQFNGVLTNVAVTAATEDALKLAITVKITGAIDWSA